MTNVLPAGVTLSDLPTGTTITGAEILEAVQTTGGVGASIQVPISQIMTTTLGGLPIGGATGTFLQKTGGTNFASNWTAISSNVLASTGLTASGSTTLSLSLASGGGLSVLAIPTTSTGVPSPLLATGPGQVLRCNDPATSIVWGPVLLGSNLAVTGILPGANFSAVNLGATGAGGVQGFLPGTSIASTSIAGTAIATGAIGTTQLLTAAGLSILAVASSGTSNFSVVSGAAGQTLGVNPAGTGVVFQGGTVLLNTLSPNNVASATDTTSLTNTFRNYMVTFENVCPVTQTTTFQLQVATTGTAFISANYVSMAQVNVSSVFVTDTSTSVILLSGTRATTQLQTATTYGLFGFVKFFNPASGAFRKQIVGDVSYLTPGASGTTTNAQAQIAGYYDGANNAITGLQFLFNSGNIQTGTIRIYGMF